MINFFYKKAFVNIHPTKDYEYNGEALKQGHLLRVSSIIRGAQIADYLGARINPSVWVEGEPCIYVKPHVKAHEDFDFPKNSYLDIIDGWGLIPLAEKHPEVPVIVISQKDKETLELVLKNKIILIPQHHVNFEREERYSEAVTNVGVVGTESSFKYLPEGLEEGLAQRGMKLVKLSHFETRETVQEFYKNLFVQIVWRPYRRRMGNPLKIVNASSFGVPTIALEEEYFKEVNGCYIGVKTLDEVFEYIDIIKSGSTLAAQMYYDTVFDCLEQAERYHISNIAKLYQQL